MTHFYYSRCINIYCISYVFLLNRTRRTKYRGTEKYKLVKNTANKQIIHVLIINTGILQRGMLLKSVAFYYF